MSWLDVLFAGRTPPHAIEIEHTHIRVEAGNDHEERAIEYLEKADGMVYSNSFERAARCCHRRRVCRAGSCSGGARTHAPLSEKAQGGPPFASNLSTPTPRGHQPMTYTDD